MFIDVHTHLTDNRLNAEEEVEKFINQKGEVIIDSAFDFNTIKGVYKNSQKFKNVYFTIGIHPSNVEELSNECIKLIKDYSQNKKCVAIGEIGFDYHYENFDKKKQYECFHIQTLIADSLNLPIVIHSRDASLDTLNFIKEHKNNLNNGFLLHCFSESKEMAIEFEKLGAYFSFGGVTTFKNSKKEEIIKAINPDRLLVETDAPYLTPEPLRGKLNNPSNVKYVYAKMAEILNLPLYEFEDKIRSNAYMLFKKLNNK